MANLGAVRRERFLTIYNPLNPPGVGWVNIFFFFKVRVSIRTCVPNLGAIRRERFLTIYNPLNPPGVGWVNFFKVRVCIRTCVPNLGAIRRERFLTIYNPLNPPGVGWVNFFFKGESIYPHMRAKFGRDPPRFFLTIYNPLNPPGVGWVNIFILFKVRVSIRTCVPNLGAVRRSCPEISK